MQSSRLHFIMIKALAINLTGMIQQKSLACYEMRISNKNLDLQTKCVCDLLLHISRVYHSDFSFESPLLCYVVQSRQHPLMAIAYLLPPFFPC